MSKTALYNSYRPQTFDDIVGQSHVVTILQEAASHNKQSHVYLLVGPRGTGKTTTARLIAKSLNCLENPAHKPYPCNNCEICTSIKEGNFLDVIEIDAASNTGVDDMRDVIEKAQFHPSLGRAKVYIIDEVHMLSKSAFNALLKILEEPPTSTYFVLATTEINKIPSTILSRCQRFDFQKLNIESILQRLIAICHAEQIFFEEEALQLIAKAADGGMRDAINMLDQMNHGEKILLLDVREFLGLGREPYAEMLIEAILEKNSKNIKNTLQNWQNQSPNISIVMKYLLGTLRAALYDETITESKRNTLISIAEILFSRDFRHSFSPFFELELLLLTCIDIEKKSPTEDVRVEKQIKHEEKNIPVSQREEKQSQEIIPKPASPEENNSTSLFDNALDIFGK